MNRESRRTSVSDASSYSHPTFIRRFREVRSRMNHLLTVAKCQNHSNIISPQPVLFATIQTVRQQTEHYPRDSLHRFADPGSDAHIPYVSLDYQQAILPTTCKAHRQPRRPRIHSDLLYISASWLLARTQNGCSDRSGRLSPVDPAHHRP